MNLPWKSNSSPLKNDHPILGKQSSKPQFFSGAFAVKLRGCITNHHLIPDPRRVDGDFFPHFQPMFPTTLRRYPLCFMGLEYLPYIYQKFKANVGKCIPYIESILGYMILPCLWKSEGYILLCSNPFCKWVWGCLNTEPHKVFGSV